MQMQCACRAWRPRPLLLVLALGVAAMMHLRAVAAAGEKIAVVGAGSWGTSVAYKLGHNNPGSEIALWALEEVLPDGRNLTDVINTDRVNAKYLPCRRACAHRAVWNPSAAAQAPWS